MRAPQDLQAQLRLELPMPKHDADHSPDGSKRASNADAQTPLVLTRCQTGRRYLPDYADANERDCGSRATGWRSLTTGGTARCNNQGMVWTDGGGCGVLGGAGSGATQWRTDHLEGQAQPAHLEDPEESQGSRLAPPDGGQDRLATGRKSLWGGRIDVIRNIIVQCQLLFPTSPQGLDGTVVAETVFQFSTRKLTPISHAAQAFRSRNSLRVAECPCQG